MKRIPLIFTLFLTAALACTMSSYAQSFSFAESKIPVGKTLIYQKSNLDGSNAGYIAVFYKSLTTIESFKWRDGQSSATKVLAEIDHATMNVRKFESYGVASDGVASKRAELQVDQDGTFNIMIGDTRKTQTFPKIHWHSYDFDFASLGYAYRFFSGPRDGVQFNIYDLDLTAEPLVFKDFGRVEMSYEQTEMYAGVLASKFVIDGPGLDNRGGRIWFSEETGELIGFEIQKPDEPGYESGKLVLLRSTELSDKEWLTFQVDALNG